MARKKIYTDYKIPNSVVAMVRVVCVDYVRRDRALRWDMLTVGVKMEFERLNRAVDGAVIGINADARGEFIKDIGIQRGYDFSPCSIYYAKNTYYAKKRKAIYDIAVALNLV